MNDDTVLKIIVVGDAGTGKSSIIQQYCFNKFVENNPPTIGPDFFTKSVKNQKNTYKFQIWDIAGQERYQSITKMFVRNSKGCLIITDGLNDESILNAQKWRSVIKENASESIPVILVQNKMDLYEQLEEQEQKRIEELYKTIQMNFEFSGFHQVSAKKKSNIQELFIDLLEKSINSLEETRPQSRPNNSNKISLVSNSTTNYNQINNKNQNNSSQQNSQEILKNSKQNKSKSCC